MDDGFAGSCIKFIVNYLFLFMFGEMLVTFFS